MTEQEKITFEGDDQLPSWVAHWHVHDIIFPRRSITGRLLYGRVLRRRDGRRWIYKQLTGFEPIGSDRRARADTAPLP